MQYKRSVLELIKNRRSCRTYATIGATNEELTALMAAVEQIQAKTGVRARFVLAGHGATKSDTGSHAVAGHPINGHSTDSSASGGRDVLRLGTYGMIKGATTFLAGIVDRNDHDPVAFGSAFEQMILAATDLGLATCWLGGTFQRSALMEAVGIGENEWIPIITPVGKEHGKPRLLDGVFRGAIGADRRKHWNELFFQSDGTTPLPAEEAGQWRIPLEMVRLGPSASNKQPWRAVVRDGSVDFYLARNKGYGLPGFDIQKNDLGIALAHFELAARALGLPGGWRPVPPNGEEAAPPSDGKAPPPNDGKASPPPLSGRDWEPVAIWNSAASWDPAASFIDS